MSLFLDKKYVSLVAPKLERFQQKKEYLWTFRCPHCGDSKKNKLKTRGYFYRKKSNLSFICHNCHTSMSFGNFLNTLDHLLYKEYILERYKEESHSNVSQPDFSLAKEKPTFSHTKTLSLPATTYLEDSHPAKLYVMNRKIPYTAHSRLYYAEDFAEFVAQTFPHYDLTRLQKNDPRLVIPFFDASGNLLGVQGRSLSSNPKAIRYITIKSSDDAPKIYGLDTVDLSRSIFVVEGPIDSLFLDNAVATMDGALYKIVDLLGKDKDFVFVYDCEARNKDVLRCMEKTIAMNHKICIWPKSVTGKDINEMVLNGIDDVQKIIRDNVFQGPRAKLEFEVWRKV